MDSNKIVQQIIQNLQEQLVAPRIIDPLLVNNDVIGLKTLWEDFAKKNQIIDLHNGIFLGLIWTITPTIILIAIPSFGLIYAMDTIIDPDWTFLKGDGYMPIEVFVLSSPLFFFGTAKSWFSYLVITVNFLLLYSSLNLSLALFFLSIVLWPFNIYFIVALNFLVISYNLLYSHWKEPKAISSFFFFSINMIILFSFCSTIGLLCIYGLPYPILWKDIAENFGFRSLIYLAISVLLFFFFLIGLILETPTIKNLILFPYLSNEMAKGLGAFAVTNKLCSLLIRKLHVSQTYTNCYKIFYIFFHISLRAILLFLITYVIFFDADWRLVIYLTPLSFCAWLYGHLNYYFMQYLTGAPKYVYDCVNIKFVGQKEIEFVDGLVALDLQDYTFSLTSFGKSQGFDDTNLSRLLELWVVYLKVITKLSFTKKKFFIYSSFLLSFLNIFLWCFTSLSYFDSHVSNILLMFPCMTRSSKIFFHSYRPFANTAYQVKYSEEAQLITKTKGNFAVGHFVILDLQEKNANNEVAYKGCLTSKKIEGAVEINGQQNITGQAKPQYAKLTAEKTFVEPTIVHQIIKDSPNYLAQSPAKDILEAHDTLLNNKTNT